MKLLLFIAAFVCSFTVQAQKEGKTKKSDKQIFTYVDQMPEPTFDYLQYLGENTHYPDSARAHNIEGRVVVKFVVTEKGYITDAQVTKSVDKDLDAEALRVIRKMPRWKPGRQNGKPVKVYFTAPINFKLED